MPQKSSSSPFFTTFLIISSLRAKQRVGAIILAAFAPQSNGAEPSRNHADNEARGTPGGPHRITYFSRFIRCTVKGQ
jgi:hypothetical protein